MTQTQWCVHISWLACDHPAPGVVALWHGTGGTARRASTCASSSMLLLVVSPASIASHQAKPGLSVVLMCQISIPAATARPLNYYLACRYMETWSNWAQWTDIVVQHLPFEQRNVPLMHSKATVTSIKIVFESVIPIEWSWSKEGKPHV